MKIVKKRVWDTWGVFTDDDYVGSIELEPLTTYDVYHKASLVGISWGNRTTSRITHQLSEVEKYAKDRPFDGVWHKIHQIVTGRGPLEWLPSKNE